MKSKKTYIYTQNLQQKSNKEEYKSVSDYLLRLKDCNLYIFCLNEPNS